MSSIRIHCCYIIIGTECKEKYTLEQDECFFYAIISSGLKEKNVCPFLLLENSRPPISSLRTPDPFLLLGDPRLINLPKNGLSQSLEEFSTVCCDPYRQRL